MTKKDLSAITEVELFEILEKRFAKFPERHVGLMWESIEQALRKSSKQLKVLLEMERTGGEPDVVGVKEEGYLFYECSAETPKGRRSYCYDEKARLARKKFPPANSAQAFAKEKGFTLLTESEYAYLQTIGDFDLKTSSWLATPEDVRALGGALFGDKRYGRTFTYHNGADSYYSSRGFRGKIVIPFEK